jgi:hypothetical protein
VVPLECLWVEDVGGGHSAPLPELGRVPTLFEQVIG